MGSKLTPRPEWPEGREPINGGLLLVQAAAVALILALLAIGCWLLWWVAVMVEAL